MDNQELNNIIAERINAHIDYIINNSEDSRTKKEIVIGLLRYAREFRDEELVDNIDLSLDANLMLEDIVFDIVKQTRMKYNNTSGRCFYLEKIL